MKVSGIDSFSADENLDGINRADIQFTFSPFKAVLRLREIIEIELSVGGSLTIAFSCEPDSRRDYAVCSSEVAVELAFEADSVD